MKEDKIKDFIQKNKSEAEEERPSAGLWDKIESQLPEQPEEKMVPLKKVWRIALSSAAVLALAVAAFQFSGSQEKQAQEEGDMSIDQLEVYYTSQVNSRIEQLKMYEVDDELLEEVALLKEEFNDLKNEAHKGVNQEDILDSMIDNYRLRVQILEDIMREVKKNEGRNDIAQ